MSDAFLLGELILSFLILCLVRVPIALALAGSALLLAIQLNVDTMQVVVQMYRGVNLFVLLAIPFFLLAGEVMNAAKITHDLINAAGIFVGKVRGGLAQINILASMVFAGISGSSTADTAAVGAVMIPAMKEAGYSARFSVAITAASSTMGNLIPPSIYMVVYGAFAGVSISNLFLAGVVPGILVGLTQMIFVYIRAGKGEVAMAGAAVPDSVHKLKLVLRVVPAALIGLLVVGGMVVGWFTATEAAAMASVYTIMLAVFYLKKFDFDLFGRVLLKSGRTFSAILFTISGAAAFGWALAYIGGADLIAKAMIGISDDRIVVLLLVAAVLLVLGTFLSEIATIIIFTPIFLQLQEAAHIDPLLMGIVVVMMLCLGLITPPYGICLLIAAQIGKVELGPATKAVLPFILLFLAVVLMIILVPDLTLFLPRMFGV